MQELKAFIKDDIARVASLMERLLRSDIALLQDCNKHIMGNGGKMVRPILTVLMAKAVGDCNDNTIRFAVTGELIHNATLLHDDVVDSSSSRRGAKTVSAMLGPRPSVLLGDYWLAKGLTEIAGGGKDAFRVLDCYCKTLCDLSRGEMLQLEMASSGATTEDDYLQIIYSKTASLFEAAALAGAISAQATKEQEEAASAYAKYIGLAFQIKDDILDYEGDSALGKPTGQDIREKKITLPLLCAFKDDPAGEKAIREKLIAGGPSVAEEIMDYVAEKGGCAAAKQQVALYIDKACEALGVFPESPAKRHLLRLAYYVGDRNY